MRRIHLAGLAAALGLPLLLPACSGGGSSADGGTMFIETCSLGCSNGQGSLQVSCSIVNVAQNVEITVLFSRPIELSSVNAASFRITNTLNGSSPVGSFTLDPTNARRLIFRPALTFDAIGNPIFALDPNQTYEILIPGQAQGDPGPYITGTNGKRNETRLRCTIATTQGLLDPVPGAPVASSKLVVTKQSTGEVEQEFDPAQGSVGVPVGGGTDDKLTSIVTSFNDIMNPATLVNLSTGQSSFITVEIDQDGDLATDDRVPQPGSFGVEVSFEQLRTTLTFTPTGGFPSGGSANSPRLMVLSLPATALDIVGNPLQNPGQTFFQTELIDFPPLVLPEPDPEVPGDLPGEQFQNQNNLDVARSGADWGNGRLTYGRGGGSGRLGALTVIAGAANAITLDTESQTFPLPGQPRDLLDNAVPGVDYDPLMPATWPTVTVTDGAFEFSRLRINSNGRLAFTGAAPARVFSRGAMTIDGTVDLSGGSAPSVESNTGNNANNGQATALGGAGGAGGPAAGAGGAGADRFNHGDNDAAGCQTLPMLTAGGITFSPSPPQNPGTDNDGRSGEGVGGTMLGAGQGGLHWPPNPPRKLSNADPNGALCFGDLEYVIVPDPGSTTGLSCRVAMVAGAGSGGAYALDGSSGVPVSPQEGLVLQPGNLELTPGPTSGGSSVEVGLEPPGDPADVRRLAFEDGNLRGGSGGGGGGMSIYGTKRVSPPTNDTDCFPNPNLFPYWDHRGAGGGGGGGAVQIVSGTQITIGLAGSIDAGGGDGGGSTTGSIDIASCTNSQTMPDCEAVAAPGGGGSGGAVRLQSLVIDLSLAQPNVIVEGGMGGVGSTGSVGGDGSPGLVRIEKANPGPVDQEAALYATSIRPQMPNDPEFNDPFPSAAILSIGEWGFQRSRPDSLSASMSCWMIPQGNFFELSFVGDDASAPDDPAAKGWNMDIVYSGPSGTELWPYRGIPSDAGFPLTGMDFQEFLGNLINSDLPAGMGSLVAVRFQGARTAGDIADPCNVGLAGITAEIQPGSLTPWVQAPADLNLFSPQPDMIRFCVVLEENLKSQGPVQFRIQGVTNLSVQVQPN